MNRKPTILSTAAFPYSLADHALEDVADIDMIPFTTVSPAIDDELAAQISILASVHITAVFTSVNAVQALAGSSNAQTIQWQVYCTGGATRQAVSRLLPQCIISGTGADAADVAQCVINDDIKDVVFFCGDKHLPVLPAMLAAAGISITELTVYETVATPQSLSKPYDAVLFFSPGGAESFFSANSVLPHTVLFAIGNTTAAAVRAQSNNSVITGSSHSKEQLLIEAIQYLQKTATVQVTKTS